jgi:hypothetical protein
MVHPIDVQVDYGDGSRSRGYAALGVVFFLKALLLVPHWIGLYFVGLIAAVAAWIGYWAILFTGHQPKGISSFISGSLRWSVRSSAWLASTYDSYPKFGFEDASAGSQTTIQADGGERNRLLAAAGISFLKPLLLLPHIIILVVLQFAAVVAIWLGFWAILFTGSFPRVFHEFSVGTLRWLARVQGWATSLTDQYPPFSMD